MNNTIDMIPEMVTLKEASNRTGVSYDWLRKLCLQGKIVHIRAGSKYLLNFGKLIDYLNTGDPGDQEKGETDNEYYN